MDRNMRSNYVNSGPRSLPHMNNNKRHASVPHHHHHHNNHRLSPPQQPSQPSSNITHTSSQNSNQHEDLIHYIYDSWNKVTRDLERGEEPKYYQEQIPPRHLANFRAFNLEDLWARRLVQSLNRKHRS